MDRYFLTIISTLFVFGVVYHVSYPSNFIVFGIMSLLILFYMRGPFTVDMPAVYIIFSFIALFTFYLLLNITLHEDVNYKLVGDSMKKIGLSIVIFVFVILFYFNKRELLAKSINYALAIIVGLWFMQFIVFYTTGHYIDLMPIRAQRYEAYFIETVLPFELIRPTSIFIEPGTYGVNTVPLLILSYIANNNKLSKLHIMTLISFFLSLSMFAILVATLFIIAAELPKFELKLTYKNVALAFFGMIVAVVVWQYIQFRFIQEGNTGALDFRNNMFNYWLSQDDWNLIIGQGHTSRWIDEKIADASFLFKFIFEFGFFTIPYFLLIIYISWGRPLLFLMVLFSTKIHYQIYIIWFYFAALYLIHHVHSREEQEESVETENIPETKTGKVEISGLLDYAKPN